jgi:hypothetical protein
MTQTPVRIQNFINGEFVEPISGRYLDNIEPATGKPYSQVADSDAHDVDLAVAAAEKAFCDWSQTPATDRSRCTAMQDASRNQTTNCYHFCHVHGTNLGPGVLCSKREIRIRLRIGRRGFACT